MTDFGSHEESEALLRQLLQDFEREAARVAVDWGAAAERIRAAAPQQESVAADGESSGIALGLDVTLLIRTLQSLRSGAGTDAFVAAFTEARGHIDPPPA